MPELITIPRLGWSMEEGVFGEWLKAPGEFVRTGEMIFVLEGEKAAHEIESFDSGYLCVPPDAPRPGTAVRVGDVIGFLLAEGEPAPNSVRSGQPRPAASDSAAMPGSMPPVSSTSTAASLPVAIESKAVAGLRAAGPAARRLARQLGIDLQRIDTPDPTGRILCEDVQRADETRRRSQSGGTLRRAVATPRARRRARELNVDWTGIQGSGRGGRICERDVLNELSRRNDPDVQTAVEIPPPAPGHFMPASKVRQVIAQRLGAGVHAAVPVTLFKKIDAGPLVLLREHLKSVSPDQLIPSYNDILIYWVARTLVLHPALNACWYRQGIYRFDAVHLAMAVDTPDGLLAPVIRHADQLTLSEIAETTAQLISKARSGQLSQNHLSGGTFTVTSLGMFGIDSFTPVLNMPQAGILGVGRIVEEPVVRDGRITAGHTLTLSLTFDHRVIDGAPAARFLQQLSDQLQAPVQNERT